MGVHGLWSLLQPVGKPVRLEALEGKILAIDVSLWLHQAAKGMRDRSGNPVPNAHLIVLFNRVCKLLYYRIKPIFVFDGGVPVLKWQTLAHRREQKETAADKSGEISNKLLHNILKQQLLNKTIEKNSPKKKGGNSNAEESPSKTVARLISSKPRQRDLFELDELPETSQKYFDELNEEDPWDHHHSMLDSRYQNIKDINVDSEEFQALPPEIQHEFLKEIKESMKRSSWNQIQELPEDAGGFASYQISKLLKQNKITNQIDKVQEEIIARKSGKISTESGIIDQVVNIQKIASEDSSHFIFVKGLQKDTALEVIEKKKEEMKDSEDSDGESSKPAPSYKCPDSVNTSGNLWVEEMKYGVKKKPCEQLPNIKQEKDFLNSKVKLQEDSEGSANSQNIFNVDKNILFNWAKFAESGSHSADQTSLGEPENNSSKTLETKVSLSDSDSGESEEDSVPPKTVLNQKKAASGVTATENKPGVVGGLKDSLSSEKHGTSLDNSSLLSNGVTVDDAAKIDVTVKDVITDDESKKDVIVPDEDFEEKKIQSDSGESEDEDLLEVNEIEDVEKFYNDRFHSVSDQPHDITMATVSLANEEGNQMPDDRAGIHTLYNEDDEEEEKEEEEEEEVVRDFQRKVEVNEFEGLTQETMSTMRSELEAESNVLLQERGKQERLAMTISDQMRLEAQELLLLFGVPFLVSPMEAEAQCAYLDITKQTDGSITDDSDVWLFGGQRVYKNFFNQNKQVELFTMADVNNVLGLEREKLIKMAFLCGSDYTPGIAGVGPVTALEILAEFNGKHLEGLQTLKTWWDSTRDQIKIPQEIKLKSKLRQMEIHDGFPNPSVVEAYENPEVDESEEPFSWALPKLDELRLYTSEKLGWSRNKTDEILLPVLSALNKPAKQQLEITSFFIKEPPDAFGSKKFTSKRVQRALQRSQQVIAVCDDKPTTSLNEQRMKKAKEVVEQMRKVGSLPPRHPSLAAKRKGQGSKTKAASSRGSQPLSAKVARSTAPVDYKLSESSSSDSDVN
ncbi:DNA repair protein complementing XP-G cells homolog isoform X1 [Octopus sinensis]|uniref:DNA repair protein complementing XP-G cells homolog isoform X1 n=1 Tax=Octopus sinensis TaxID=2607531 RepID=A0A6P7TKM9_9MOLL|nr:DNA repair protein complementing XP-G cells homolog isoform X1 [Octopus sinensis]